MKKYFIVTGIVNFLLSFLAFLIYVTYLTISAKYLYSTIIDLLFLIVMVLVVMLINTIIFKVMKQKEKIIILIPSSLFMVFTGLIFLVK